MHRHAGRVRRAGAAARAAPVGNVVASAAGVRDAAPAAAAAAAQRQRSPRSTPRRSQVDAAAAAAAAGRLPGSVRNAAAADRGVDRRPLCLLTLDLVVVCGPYA